MTAANEGWMRRARRARGFTLVELAVVVTIIGILAMLAVAGYRRLVTSSHTTEATEMVNAIKVAQESAGLGLGSLYPAATPVSTSAVAWGGTCASCPDPAAWQKLPVKASGPMRFGYATVSGSLNQPLPAAPVAGVTFPTNNQLTGDWFVVNAMGDMDGNNVYCSVVGVSWQRDLYIDKDGE